MPATLSLAMIVKDEADLLAGVLADASTYCDELVVVDTGSTDDSVEIARAAGASVHHFEWIDDFAAARNFAASHATCGWVTYLDADDRVPPASQAAFRALKRELPELKQVDLVQIPYRYNFWPWDSEMCVARFDITRVFRNGAGVAWRGRVHELVPDRPGRMIRRGECWVDHRQPLGRVAGKPERNLRLLRMALEDGDASLRTHYFIGTELRVLGREAEAIASFREALLLEMPDNVRYGILLNLADCMTTPEREAERLALLKQALSLDPTRAAAHVRLGVHHYERRQWAAAAEYLTAAIGCPPPADGNYNELEYSWFPRDCLVVCLTELGRFEEAIEAAELALIDNPEADRVRTNIERLRTKIAQRADGSAS